ncbi:MAG: hypothetical protein M3P06_11610 [Acidobacteriota bacterium]|nr:hypothetical protein [Acidobacteriota bacterium]
MSLLWQVALSGDQLRALLWVKDGGIKERLPDVRIDHLTASFLMKSPVEMTPQIEKAEPPDGNSVFRRG